MLDKRLINIAQRGAVMTLKSTKAVNPQLGKLSNLLSKIEDKDREIGRNVARG
jgi:hypothetical protein